MGLSALVPSFEKPLCHKSEVEEEANAQAEVQKKKDEAEVQVNLYTHGSHRSRNKGSQRPGMLVQIVHAYMHAYCLELLNGSGTSVAILISLTTFERPTLLVSKPFLLVLCPGPVITMD